MAKGKNMSALMDMMGDAVVDVAASDTGLALVSSLAQAQWDAAVKVAQAEDELQEAKSALRQISEVDLPEAMRECGVGEFVTTTGLKITLKQDLTVGIAVANRENAYRWLTDNGFGGLIKSELSLSFGRDELDKAEELLGTLSAEGYEPNLNQSIHHQTLKAFARERMADAEGNFPMDLFGVRAYQVATVKPKGR